MSKLDYNFPHSAEHTECPLCHERTVLEFPDYKARALVKMCLRCEFREARAVGNDIKNWRWTWENFRSTGLKHLKT